MKSISSQCSEAHKAFLEVGQLDTSTKNDLLLAMADALVDNTEYILDENQKDIQNGTTNQIGSALLDRLRLTAERISGVASSIRDISRLPDPVGEIMDEWTVPSGLNIKKIRVPIGVIGIIYEARPNVTADAIALTFKTGNAVVLRGSSSAYHSNFAIASTMKQAIQSKGILPEFIQLLEDTSRESVEEFVKMKDYLSLIIPRGGASLIQNVCQNATVPTIETGVGNCHIYVDKSANLDDATNIVINAKTQRPSVCNAAETLLIHRDIADTFLPRVAKALTDTGVKIKGDDYVCQALPDASQANEDDWANEFLDLQIAIKVVPSVESAISHIQTYGTLHTEAILANDTAAIDLFTAKVDASAIAVNASTRFSDGGEFGFGAEIGISTQKIHARGPMGLPELCSYKYIYTGRGTVRA